MILKYIVGMEFLGPNPGRRIIMYFAAAILVGSLVLSLPISSARQPIAYVDALFTATSATCVTGLIVLDTPKDFSLFGQIVILILIQLGGIGIMTFAIVLFSAFGLRLSFQDRLGLAQGFTPGAGGKSISLLRAVVFTTLSVELIGAALLFIRFRTQFPAAKAAYYSIFHAVAAFCNAGFSTFSTNLEAYHRDVYVIAVFSFLIISGGLGFGVIRELLDRLADKRTRLSLHTKLCLSATGILLAVGTIAFIVGEFANAFRDESLVTGITNAFFQSVTSRTAGFDSMPQYQLTEFSLMATIILMLIGACPGSTGGGIKTTTLAVICLLVYNRFRGRETLPIFKRSISNESVVRALTVFILGMLVITLSFGLMMLSESRAFPHAESRGWFVETLFETVSAFGTVGLSLGLTPSLHDLSKIILVLTMFTGRVGLLTLAFSLAQPTSRGEIVYAEEPVMTG